VKTETETPARNGISDRTVRYICALTRVHAVEDELGHKLRVLAHGNKLNQEQANRAIEMLTALPTRPAREKRSA
jgi:hypothetical protein